MEQPSELDVKFLGEVLGEFFAEQGWGRLNATPLGPAVMALDSAEWAEALDERQGEFPSCHLSCGLLADFLGRVSQDLVAVMEVECRSRGEAAVPVPGRVARDARDPVRPDGAGDGVSGGAWGVAVG